MHGIPKMCGQLLFYLYRKWTNLCFRHGFLSTFTLLDLTFSFASFSTRRYAFITVVFLLGTTLGKGICQCYRTIRWVHIDVDNHCSTFLWDDIMGDRNSSIHQLVQKFAAFRKPWHSRRQGCHCQTQTFHLDVVRIWQEPHIKYQITVRRMPVFEASNKRCNHKAFKFLIILENKVDLFFLLSRQTLLVSR